MTATMEQDQLEKLRYPTGKFEWGKEYSEDDTQKLIEKIEDFPAKFEKLVRSMRNDQLDTAYREGGWTVRQVIHHLFDSHVNAYTRFKLALTEDIPAIKPYNEKAWAELGDSRTTPPEVSVALLVNLHKRWANLLKSMSPQDFDRRFMHPEHHHIFTLKEILGMYAWHGEHHYEHINMVKKSSATRPQRTKKPLLRKASKSKILK